MENGGVESGVSRVPFETKEMIQFDCFTVWNWQYRFARDILADIAEMVSSVKAVPYPVIVEMDEKLQAFKPHLLALRQRDMSSTNGSSKIEIAAWSSRTQPSPFLTIFAKEEGKCFGFLSATSLIIRTRQLYKHSTDITLRARC